jgi:hypothetical protein
VKSLKATTANPALILFLVDGSHSTGSSWVVDTTNGEQSSISQSIQDGVNRALHDLIINVCYSDGELLERVNLSIFVAQGEDVRWGLDCEQPESGWLGVHSWANLAEQPKQSNEFPKWLSYEAEGKTPLLEGWRTCFTTIREYVKNYPSGSVLLITLTDGSFHEMNLTEHVKQELIDLQKASTGENAFLHLIGHISPDGEEPILFPIHKPEDEYEEFLFSISTKLPPHLFENGSTTFAGVEVEANSRAYVHNADHGLLSELIQLGSRFVDGNIKKTTLQFSEEE